MNEVEADESGGERATLRRVEGGMLATQIAPTVLRVLGLDPRSLEAVVKEGTTALPDLF